MAWIILVLIRITSLLILHVILKTPEIASSLCLSTSTRSARTESPNQAEAARRHSLIVSLFGQSSQQQDRVSTPDLLDAFAIPPGQLVSVCFYTMNTLL